MAGFAGANRPLRHVIEFRHAAICIYCHWCLDAKLLLRGELVGGGIKRNADDRDIKVLPRVVPFQINDLVKARLSTNRHVEKEQHVFALVIGQRHRAAVRRWQREGRSLVAQVKACLISVIDHARRVVIAATGRQHTEQQRDRGDA
jgi:hypothetical protein